MISSDYTQEIGMSAGKRSVAKPYAFAILVLIALAAGLVVKQVHAQKTAEVETDNAAASAEVSSR